VQVLVGLMDERAWRVAADRLGAARRRLNTEVQLEAKKLAKQFQYADRAGIRFFALVGEDEAARGVVTVKDLRTQAQSKCRARNSPRRSATSWSQTHEADPPRRRSLTREQVVASPTAPPSSSTQPAGAVQRAADFLDEQVRQQEPIYGVSTGFGSNADKLLGAHRLRGRRPANRRKRACSTSCSATW
jgi:hypothetical protein